MTYTERVIAELHERYADQPEFKMCIRDRSVSI